MFLFIPYTRFTLKTNLTPLEAEQRLTAVVEPRRLFRFTWSHNHQLFAGKVENGRFDINRIIHYRNSFLPMLIGQIHSDLGQTRIDITMRLHHAVTVFLVVWLMIFATAFLIPDPPLAFIFLFLGFILFFLLLFMALFNYEANKARRLLEELFQVPPDTLP